MNESAPSALYRQHHDVEAPRVDDRHFRPAWRVLTRFDGLLADPAITAAEWHAAADFRELVDRVRRGSLVRSSSLGTLRAAGHSSVNWVAGDLGRVGQAPPDPRRARCLGLHVARGGAGAGSVLGRARTALSLRSENRARLGNRRNQGCCRRYDDFTRGTSGYIAPDRRTKIRPGRLSALPPR
jgi:hypothetical protein